MEDLALLVAVISLIGGFHPIVLLISLRLKNMILKRVLFFIVLLPGLFFAVHLFINVVTFIRYFFLFIIIYDFYLLRRLLKL